MRGVEMKAFCLLTAFFLLMPEVVFGQLDTAWLRSIDGGTRNEDIFSDMYVDDSGNVYVTGMIITSGNYGDIFVQKFSPDGVVLWNTVYDGRAHEDDSASALVVDSIGNVYVCGWTTDTLADKDMVTLKLSNSGELVWVRSWFRIFNGNDAAHAIALDRLGRVIVTGYCADSFNNIDYCTICYNAENGDTVWVRYYNRTPENDEDIAYSICVDDSNNIYVTGTSYDDDTDYDIVTIKYRPNGTQAWLRRKNNWPWWGDDYGMKVIFDPVTNTIIVGGIVWDDNQDYNYFTMKYSRNGDSLWARTYNRYPANNEDLLSAVAVDQSGNVFVTGTSLDDVTDYDIATVSYSAIGGVRWSHRFDADHLEDGGADLTVDSIGQVLVIGTAETDITWQDIAFVKYDTSGTLIYSYLWDNPFSHDEDWGYKIAVQPDGQMIFAGTSYSDSTDIDIVVLKMFQVLHDFALSELILPESLYIEDTLKPEAVVTNLSINKDSCWLRLTVQPGEYRDSVWVVLTPGMRQRVSFRPFLADTVGLLTVCSWVNLPEDEKRGNDTIWKEVVVWRESSGIAEENITLRVLKLTVTPNPVRAFGLVRLDGPVPPKTFLKIYDRTGALVKELEVGGNEKSHFKFDVRPLPAGVYFLCLDQPRGGITKKVVVQH